MDDLLAARLQMAMSLAFHIIFAAIGIGMPLLMTLAEWRWLRTGGDAWLRLTKHWAKGTAIFFAVGAVSGTVLSFELGLLWPGFMEHAGGIIGFPFSLEGFAFFTEAIFLGVYLYGWGKIGPRLHLAAGALVALSGAASALFVVMANAWMNAPAGFDYDPETGVFSNIDPIAAMFNPAWLSQSLHMIIAAYMATAFGAAGLHAVGLLRRPGSDLHRKALALTMGVGAIAAVAQPISGDYAAKVVAVTQPVKLAAMEGQFETTTRAPLRIGGVPDEQRRVTPWSIEIPGLLSFLAFGDFDAAVQGLNEFPEDEWPPVATTHLAFQAMVAMGMAMLGASAWFWIQAWRRKSLNVSRWALRALVVCAPLGFLAIEAGWIVTEVGRQPWVIHGVMRTSEAVTPMPGLVVPLSTFTALYVVLGAVVAALLAQQFRAAGREEAPDAV